MACSVTVDPSSAAAFQSIAGQPPDRIELSGNATECEQISVHLISNGQIAGPVVADVNASGQRTAVFQAPGDFTQGHFPCNAADIKVEAGCVKQPCQNESTALDILPCVPAGGCPTQAQLKVFNAAGEEVDPFACVPHGTYSVTVIDPPSSASIFYLWSLNNQTQLAARGLDQHTFGVTLATTDAMPGSWLCRRVRAGSNQRQWG